MSLTLILMRHAKSDWDDPLLDDHERVLSERGRRSAPLIARWLAEGGFAPDAAVVSSARRTVETWELMAPFLPEARVEVTPALYLAGAELILKVIQAQSARCVLVLCHNPGIADCAGRLVAAPPAHPRFMDYPTAATAVIRFDGDDWSKAGWGKGQVAAFAVPRDLEP